MEARCVDYAVADGWNSAFFRSRYLERLSIIALRASRGPPQPSILVDLSSFEFLVDGEEVFDFAADVGKDLIHCVDLVIAGIARGHR